MRSSYTILLLKLALSYALLSGVSSAAQPARPVKKPAAGPPDSFLDAAVATVNERKITRRDVTHLYIDYYHKNLTAELDSGRAPGRPAVDARGDASKSRQAALSITPVSEASLSRIGHRLFKNELVEAQNVLKVLMIDVAMQEAAAQHHLTVTEADVATVVHRQLERQRVSAGLPEMPDRLLAEALGLDYAMIRLRTLEAVFVQRLTLADLLDELGHTPRTEDFFSLHLIALKPQSEEGAPKETDWERAKEKAASLRADLLAGKITFEDAARKNSTDLTAKAGGNVGTVVRKLLNPDLEAALLALKPGELTQPIKIKSAYVIARLDRRGAELTDADRKAALDLCSHSARRKERAVPHMLKNIQWTTTLGSPPEWYRKMPSG